MPQPSFFFNSLLWAYLNCCSVIWGNTYKTSLQLLCILQKRAIRIIHKAHHHKHTNQLFLKSKPLKSFYLLEIKIAQLMFKARKNLFLAHIQKMFFEREGGYNLKGQLKVYRISVTIRSFCISTHQRNIHQSISSKEI